jgi:hypothetical protein
LDRKAIPNRAHQKREPDGPAAGQPGIGPERDGDEEEQHRVGRDIDRGQRNGRRGRIGHAGPAGIAVADDPPCAGHQDERRRHVEKRTRKPYEDDVVRSGKRRDGTDDPGDHRRLRIVAEIEILAPEPVLRLVDEQIGAMGQQRDAPDRDGDDDENGGSGGHCSVPVLTA